MTTLSRNKTPFFSIVIPTRNRLDTLKYSVDTVLLQTFDDFELVISDNSTNRETENYFQNCADDKIKYLRTNGQLCMSENWENALSRVSGKYVLFLGDDDGLVKDALERAYSYIVNNPCEVLKFDWMSYNWPEQSNENVVSDYIKIPEVDGEIVSLDGSEILKNILNVKTTFYTLPSIYYSFVSLDLLKRILSGNKRFFVSTNPDIYSGVAISYFSKKMIKVDSVLGIRGTSSMSNGAVFGNDNGKNQELKDDFINLNNQSALVWHRDAPNILHHYAFSVEAYLQLCNAFNIRIGKLEYAKIYFKLGRRSYFDQKNQPEKARQDLKEIIEVLKRNKKAKGFLAWIICIYLRQLFRKTKTFQVDSKQPRSIQYGYVGDNNILDGKKLGIRNIVDLQNYVYSNNPESLVSPPRVVDLSIVIVNYKTPEMTRQCIEYLCKNGLPGNIEIIVVDNNSGDDSEAKVREVYPFIKWIQNNFNYGFGTANNIGIDYSVGDIILMINSDLMVSMETILACENRIKNSPEIGALGCKLLNEDGTVQRSSYHSFGTFMDVLHQNLILDKFFGFSKRDKPVNAVMGSFFMIKKSLFKEVGEFDPDYFMYAEEIDLCRRIKASGKEIVYVAEYSAIHKSEGSSSNKSTTTKQRYLSDSLLQLKSGGVLNYLLYHFLFHVNTFTNFFAVLWLGREHRTEYFAQQKAYFSNYLYYFRIPFLYSKNIGSGKQSLKRSYYRGT